MTNKHVLEHACHWLPALLSCIQAPRTEAKKKKDEENVGVRRLTKLGKKQRKAGNKVGMKTKDTHVCWGTHETMDWKLMGWSYTLDLMLHWQGHQRV